jgi:hypothetical protein
MLRKWDIVESHAKLHKDTLLKNVLDKSVLAVVAEKSLQIHITPYPDSHLLVQESVFAIESEKYIIKDYMLVALRIFAYFKEESNDNVKDAFPVQVALLKYIKDELTQNRYQRDYEQIEKCLWEIIILESNLKTAEDFVTVFQSLDTFQDEDKYQFISAYSHLLPVLKLNAAAIFENAVCCLKLTEKDVNYNVPKGEVLDGIRQLSKRKESIAHILFETATSSQDFHAKQIASPVVSGIYELCGTAFYNKSLLPKIMEGSCVPEILFGLVNPGNIDEELVKHYFELYDLLASDESLTVVLVRMLLTVTKSTNHINKDAAVKRAVSLIKEKVSKDDPPVILLVLQEISFLDEFEIESVDIILSIISQDHFTVKNYLKPIAAIFWRKFNIDSLKKILLAITVRAPFQSISNEFASATYHFVPSEVDDMVTGFLVDSKASVRYLGRDMLTNINHSFRFDPLKLSPLDQYKFWVSMGQNILQPINYLPHLFPLFHSPSITVRECFMAKLEVLTEDYGDHIISLMEKNLDLTVALHQEVLQRIRKYSNTYYEQNIKIKHGLPEINPYYTHHRLFKEYNDMHHREFRKAMSLGADKNSFLSQLTTNVMLAKGGGWKMGDRKEVSKLASISTSMVLPRALFKFPDQYEVEAGVDQRADWSDKTFETIEKWIADE